MIPRLQESSFAEFVGMAPRLTRERGAWAVYETRMAHALAALRPELASQPASPVHRCDLARAWCSARGIPSEVAPRALVCEGVRHALRLLLAPLARGRVVLVPSDVYPVYGVIASEQRVGVRALETWPTPALERSLDDSVHVALLPWPWKLHGRAWSGDEIEIVSRWLRGDSARRLILDGVYSFGGAFDSALLGLLATEQVVVLDSMSKGWLHEQIFGAAIVPERDLDVSREVVRAAAPSLSKRTAARDLLADHRDTPAAVVRTIDRRRASLCARLEARRIPHVPSARGYLVAIERSAEALLDEYGVLALPASVFGSSRIDRCFASALAVSDHE